MPDFWESSIGQRFTRLRDTTDWSIITNGRISIFALVEMSEDENGGLAIILRLVGRNTLVLLTDGAGYQALPNGEWKWIAEGYFGFNEEESKLFFLNLTFKLSHFTNLLF